MRAKRISVSVAVAVALALVLPASASSAAAPDRARATAAGAKRGTKPVRVPVSFAVMNRNESRVACPTDGVEYTVRGHVTATRGSLSRARKSAAGSAAALYVHGHGFGEFLWNFDAVQGYDTTRELAKSGHISVTYDRLGYDSSDKPNGYLSCYGSEADVAHQIVDLLRAGEYTPESRRARRLLGAGKNGGKRGASRSPLGFERIAYVGHSQAAYNGTVAVYSFQNVDAYVHLSFVDDLTLFTPGIVTKYAANVLDCEGRPTTANQEPGAPTGYAFRGKTDAAFEETNFANADPAVVEALTRMRNVDPCGYPRSALQTAPPNAMFSSEIDVPVLVMFGADDSNFFMPVAAEAQRKRFSGSEDVTLEVLPDTGHAMMFERTAPQFRALLSEWLTARGF